jgi:hypothetical protein
MDDYEPTSRPVRRWTRMDDAIMRAKQDEYDKMAQEIAYGQQHYRKKKKTKRKKKSKTRAKKKKIARKKYRMNGMKPETKENETEIPGVYKTIRKVENMPKSVKHHTEVVFFPKGKRAVEMLKKTGQLTKRYGKSGLSLLKKEVEYAKNWPSRIDKKTEENLKQIEEKYGPLKIRYTPESDEVKVENYSRAKKRKPKRKKPKRKKQKRKAKK